MHADLKEKAWKSVWIWAKSLQNRLKINKSAEIWASWKPEFKQLPENLTFLLEENMHERLSSKKKKKIEVEEKKTNLSPLPYDAMSVL